jgi:hypothetical protein
MPMTNETYCEQGAENCPMCGSTAISATDEVQTDSHGAWQRIRCIACGSTWNDVYRLVGYDNVTEGRNIWTQLDQERALRQGWGVFDVDQTGLLQIQKSDESGRFDTDAEAICYVIGRADCNDDLAIKGIAQMDKGTTDYNFILARGAHHVKSLNDSHDQV